MDGLVARGLKACLLFVLMYFSLTFVGCSPRAAAIAGSIPLVLGLLNVLTGTAFSIAAVVFIGAALTALLPAEYRDVPKLVRALVADVARDESVPFPAVGAAPAPAAVVPEAAARGPEPTVSP